MTLDQSSYDPDLDMRLRRELGAADLTPLDPASLTAAGGRALRRRRLVGASGATVAVLALAVGGYVAQETFSRNASPAPPMGTTATTAVVAPEVTAVLEPLNAYFGTGTGPSTIPGPAHFAVTWQRTPSPGGRDLTFSTVGDKDALTAIGASSTVGLSREAVTWGAGSGIQAIIGVLPAAATHFTIVQPYDPSGGHGSTSTRAPLPGSPWQAFAAAFQDAGDIDSIVDILWMGQDGVVHDKSGRVVPSVAIGARDRRVLYVSDAADTMGTFSSSGSDGSVWLSGSEHPVLSMGRSKDAASPMDGLFAMLVPSGSTRPALTPSASTLGSSDPVITEIPGSAWAVLWSEYTSSGTKPKAAYTKVEWTAPNGATTTITTF